MIMQKEDVRAIKKGIQERKRLYDECVRYLKENPNCEYPEEVREFMGKLEKTNIEMETKLRKTQG